MAKSTNRSAATKRANTKTSKADKEDKPKRAPSAYNLFVQAHMKEWKEAHPGAPIKEAMAEIAAMWREAPENPNRGKEPKPRKPKAAAGAPKASRKKKQTPPPSSDAENTGDVSDD
ncbi:uncharacterized protein F5147DRAFT_697198 [Suillus discolor]|uniref:HMG box domain-containing protein n=1 Tax=Suillus discolor TaxID=1912936 RepID=A0A9P7F581_9AGAM|nr:uncharacterized protein F5147DRAFT_697198 [Suillus discolor]KAG2107421.1 hypothetical protein F5147DRAFT_697198 [Suillus discolor]